MTRFLTFVQSWRLQISFTCDWHTEIITIRYWKPSTTTFWNMNPQYVEALILPFGQDAEIIACRDFLRKSTRTPGQSFTECTSKFDSAYCHHQQLLHQIGRQELQGTAISTLKQISPFLVSDKCSKLFTSWAKQQAQHKQPVTKERILDVIQRIISTAYR